MEVEEEVEVKERVLESVEAVTPLLVAEMVLVESRQHDLKVVVHYVANGAQGHHKGQLYTPLVLVVEEDSDQLVHDFSSSSSCNI